VIILLLKREGTVGGQVFMLSKINDS